MQYEWRLDEFARLMAHKHYLEDILDDVIDQKNIAVNWLREKFHAVGPMQVFRDNHIRYMTEDGEEHEHYWSVTTREGQEFEQFVTPIKRYSWVEDEWKRVEQRIDDFLHEVRDLRENN